MNFDYVAAIIVRDHKVLLLERSPKEKDEQGKWNPVNETLQENESPEEAVIRGVKEELGVNFSLIKRLPDHLFDGNTAVFLGSISYPIIPNDEEVSSFGWFTYEETSKLELAYGYERVIERLFKSNLIS